MILLPNSPSVSRARAEKRNIAVDGLIGRIFSGICRVVITLLPNSSFFSTRLKAEKLIKLSTP